MATSFESGQSRRGAQGRCDRGAVNALRYSVIAWASSPSAER